MEPKIVGISRKVWNIVRVAIFMIKKGLCKKKFVMDLNLMMKRSKIAGKALGNLMFNPNNHHLFASQGGIGGSSDLPNEAREYEFSCSKTPLYRHYFTNKLNKMHHHQNNNDHYYMPSPFSLEDVTNVNLEDVNDVLDMMLRNEGGGGGGALSAASPSLGFGRRITDSPFPVVRGMDQDNNNNNKHVDQDAEDFIKNFYSQLKQQK